MPAVPVAPKAPAATASKVPFAQTEPALLIGGVVAIIETLLATAIPMPDWLHATLAGVVGLAGLLGIRASVSSPKTVAAIKGTP